MLAIMSPPSRVQRRALVCICMPISIGVDGFSQLSQSLPAAHTKKKEATDIRTAAREMETEEKRKQHELLSSRSTHGLSSSAPIGRAKTLASPATKHRNGKKKEKYGTFQRQRRQKKKIQNKASVRIASSSFQTTKSKERLVYQKTKDIQIHIQIDRYRSNLILFASCYACFHMREIEAKARERKSPPVLHPQIVVAPEQQQRTNKIKKLFFQKNQCRFHCCISVPPTQLNQPHRKKRREELPPLPIQLVY